MEVVSINPVFNELDNPETLIKHIEQLSFSIDDHNNILGALLNQIEPIDFEKATNPHSAENFKLNTKHYTVLAIENIINIAEVNN